MALGKLLVPHQFPIGLLRFRFVPAVTLVLTSVASLRSGYYARWTKTALSSQTNPYFPLHMLSSHIVYLLSLSLAVHYIMSTRASQLPGSSQTCLSNYMWVCSAVALNSFRDSEGFYAPCSLRRSTRLDKVRVKWPPTCIIPVLLQVSSVLHDARFNVQVL